MSLSEKMRLNSYKSRMVKVNYFQLKGLYMLMPRNGIMTGKLAKKLGAT